MIGRRDPLGYTLAYVIVLKPRPARVNQMENFRLPSSLFAALQRGKMVYADATASDTYTVVPALRALVTVLMRFFSPGLESLKRKTSKGFNPQRGLRSTHNRVTLKAASRKNLNRATKMSAGGLCQKPQGSLSLEPPSTMKPYQK